MKKTALITGGAGEIGSAISRKFADNGFDIIVTYNSKAQKAEDFIQTLPAGNHSIFHAPNTDEAKIDSLKAMVIEKYGKLDVLVNNAGITTPIAHDNLTGLTNEWIDRIMQTNFRGSFAMIRAFQPLLEKSNEQTALVVNISSIAGIFGVGSNVAYCASKAALDSMTRSLARALAPKIRVISVSPGFVEGEYTKGFDPDFLETQRSLTPLNRFAINDDVANAVYSTFDRLTFTTGSIITIDGGRLLQ